MNGATLRRSARARTACTQGGPQPWRTRSRRSSRSRLTARPEVTRIRKVDRAKLLAPTHARTQPMAGFEDDFRDVVDYIVRITEQIWTERALGRIYDTYDASCTVYSNYGVIRSVEEVVAATAGTITAFPRDRGASPERRVGRRRGGRASTPRIWAGRVRPIWDRRCGVPRRERRSADVLPPIA